MSESAPTQELICDDDYLSFDLSKLEIGQVLEVQTVNSVWLIEPIENTEFSDAYVVGLSISSDSAFFHSGKAEIEDEKNVRMPRFVHIGGNLLIYPNIQEDARYWLSSPIRFFQLKS